MGIPLTEGGVAERARLSTFYDRETWIEGLAEDQLAQAAGWPGMKAVAGFPTCIPAATVRSAPPSSPTGSGPSSWGRTSAAAWRSAGWTCRVAG